MAEVATPSPARPSLPPYSPDLNPIAPAGGEPREQRKKGIKADPGCERQQPVVLDLVIRRSSILRELRIVQRDHPVEYVGKKQLPLWAMLGDGDSRLVRKYHSLNDFRDMWPHA